MNQVAARVGRMAVTLVMLLLAGIVAHGLWAYYMQAPWTRDGRVRADVVGVAPDVSGLVTQVLVRDNETVRKGQLLLRIDPARFALALEQAEATLDARRATLAEATREARRYRALTSLSVSDERREQTETALLQASAAYRQALADRGLAQLNLDRTQVVAPVDGVITNFDLRPGNYVGAGHAVMALIDAASLRVEGYFEETKLARIHVGDAASVRLLGERGVLQGHVESIAGGIADREREANGSLMASINPTFSWVRLAQRIPVRVRLDPAPPGVQLIPGRTASVWINDGTGPVSRPGLVAGLSALLG